MWNRTRVIGFVGCLLATNTAHSEFGQGYTPGPGWHLDFNAIVRSANPPGVDFVKTQAYHHGFSLGQSQGFDAGYDAGFRRGDLEGTDEGDAAGFDAGWVETYQPAYDTAYASSLGLGRVDGWHTEFVDSFGTAVNNLRIEVERYLTTSANLSLNIANGIIWADDLDRILSGWGRGSAEISIGGGAGITMDTFDVSGYTIELGYDEGFDDGYAEGFTTGDLSGFDDGDERAYEAAFAAAFDRGSSEGEIQGTEDGQVEGFDDGFAEGQDSANQLDFGQLAVEYAWAGGDLYDWQSDAGWLSELYLEQQHGDWAEALRTDALDGADTVTIGNAAGPITAVPEPGSLLAIALALASLVGTRRSR